MSGFVVDMNGVMKRNFCREFVWGMGPWIEVFLVHGCEAVEAAGGVHDENRGIRKHET